MNISRHEEQSKRLTRLIEAAEKLKRDLNNFRIILVGNGIDTEKYKIMVNEKNLNDIIYFLGQKENPYPYFKICDCFILTSEYEGYPVVFNECMVMNIPIITTDVSDAKKEIESKFGIVTEKNVNSIYEAMKEFIHNGYTIKKQFDAKKYNDTIAKEIDKIINGG